MTQEAEGGALLIGAFQRLLGQLQAGGDATADARREVENRLLAFCRLFLVRKAPSRLLASIMPCQIDVYLVLSEL